MTVNTLTMAATGLTGAVLILCWARFVIYYRPRPKRTLRRHPGARPSMLDKWLRIR